MQKFDDAAPEHLPMSTRVALAASPDSIPNARVTMDCRCGAHDMTDMAWFAKKFGPSTSIGGLLSRYRCRWCGGLNVKVTIATTVAKTSPATNVIPFPAQPHCR